jgi:DNA (cytosine-5)-methyltransferase 1
MRRFAVISLFSGAGGLDLGFVQTGLYEVIFANDILAPAMQTYSRNFGLKLISCGGEREVEANPGVALICSVERVDFAPLRNIEVDVVVGGPPCQDFSIVRGPENKRKGIEVRRGRLYAHFVRALATLKPKAFVFENVPGLVNANRGLAYKAIIEDFSHLNVRWDEVRKAIGNGITKSPEEGYEIVFSKVVDFTRLGVPQMRERLIIIGIRRDLLGKDIVRLWKIKQLLEYRLSGGNAMFHKYPLTPIEVFEGHELPGLQDVYYRVMKEYEGVWDEVGTPRALEWKRKVWDKLTFNIVEDYLRLNSISPGSKEELERAFEEHRKVLKELGYYGRPVKSLNPPDGSNRIPEESFEVLERLKRIPPGENHEFVRGTRWEVKGLMSNIYRRAHPLIPAPTVIAYGGGGTWGHHYERGRGMLTNRERARLQTFPDDFLFAGTWQQVRAQIGEAVPPLASKVIAEALAQVLNNVETKY